MAVMIVALFIFVADTIKSSEAHVGAKEMVRARSRRHCPAGQITYWVILPRAAW